MHDHRIRTDGIIDRSRALREGFTLIEMLAVIGLIGLLTALLLPAVQSARRALCQNHLKQIGPGVANYVDNLGFYPQGQTISEDPRFLATPSLLCSGPADRSFLVAIMPFVEQRFQFDMFNHHLAIIGPEQSTACTPVVSIFTCPSDTEAGQRKAMLTKDPWYGELDGETIVSCRPGYAGCHSVGGENVLAGPDCIVSTARIPFVNGSITGLSNFSLASVTDGLSQTMVASEKSDTAIVRKSRKWNPFDQGTTGIWVSGSLRETVFRTADPPNAFRRGEEIDCLYPYVMTASCEHPGGLNVLMGDSSVRFVKETIDSWRGSTPRAYGVWQKLASRKGSETIDAGAY